MRSLRKIYIPIVKSIIPPRLVRQRLYRKADNVVLLTFDDGPHPDITPQVLKLLDNYRARALFFIPGVRINRAPEVVKEIIRKGHMIGNHTFSHQNCAGLTFKQYQYEIFKCQKILYEITGKKPIYFRPPEGRITLSMILAAKSYKLSIIHYSVDMGEYSYMKGATSEELADNLIKIIKSKDIVLVHDDNKNIIKALEIALPKLLEMGFDLYRGLDYLSG